MIEYRILKIESSSGDKFYPQRKGKFGDWENILYGGRTHIKFYTSELEAKEFLDSYTNVDSLSKSIINYP